MEIELWAINNGLEPSNTPFFDGLDRDCVGDELVKRYDSAAERWAKAKEKLLQDAQSIGSTLAGPLGFGAFNLVRKAATLREDDFRTVMRQLEVLKAQREISQAYRDILPARIEELLDKLQEMEASFAEKMEALGVTNTGAIQQAISTNDDYKALADEKRCFQHFYNRLDSRDQTLEQKMATIADCAQQLIIHEAALDRG